VMPIRYLIVCFPKFMKGEGIEKGTRKFTGE